MTSNAPRVLSDVSPAKLDERGRFAKGVEAGEGGSRREGEGRVDDDDEGSAFKQWLAQGGSSSGFAV
jgi:hypothetical protein